MTSPNVVDVSRQTGHEKSPEEIQLEIARTRSAITEDLLALSEKLSPQHLREGAREVMRDAREEAKEIMREAKDAAIGSLRDIKDRAVHSVVGTVSEGVNVIGTQARQASKLTVGFVSANALALSLFGLGTGWLLLALRARRNRATQYAFRYEGYGQAEVDAVPAQRGRSLPATARSVATRASEAVDHAREQVRSSADHVRSSAQHLSHEAADYAQRAGGSVRRAAGRTRELASDNRLTVVALTVAAGLGLGLLLPVGRGPRRALRSAGGRAWDEAQTLGREVGARARNVLAGHNERGNVERGRIERGRVREPAASNWQLY